MAKEKRFNRTLQVFGRFCANFKEAEALVVATIREKKDVWVGFGGQKCPSSIMPYECL